jgi:hypothetical protein
MCIDQRKETIDEFLALEIADLSKCDLTAEVIVAVGVAAWTSEGTFAGNLDRKGGAITAKDSPPRGDNAFHLSNYNKGFRSMSDRLKRAAREHECRAFRPSFEARA